MSASLPIQSMIYVLHFERPFKHARHYIGIAIDGDVNRRAYEHVTGVGSPLVRAVVAAGIEVYLALAVPGDRKKERTMHNMHGPRVCPRCKNVRQLRLPD